MLPRWRRPPSKTLLAAWAGLGYYSRARNLQKAARAIVELAAVSRPIMPRCAQLPGVGDYTAAAVASIAFGMPHAVLDGNVLRVLSRMAAERGDIKSQMRAQEGCGRSPRRCWIASGRASSIRR